MEGNKAGTLRWRGKDCQGKNDADAFIRGTQCRRSPTCASSHVLWVHGTLLPSETFTQNGVCPLLAANRSVPSLSRSYVSPVSVARRSMGKPSICIASVALAISALVQPAVTYADIRLDKLGGIERASTPSTDSRSTDIGAEELFQQALAHDTGRGAEQDYAKAFTLYQRAARLGHSRAMLNTGLMLSEGQGTDTNHAEAANWLRRAADDGVPDGQYSVGVVYMQGRGVEKSYEDALYWFSQAARNGHGQAMNNLGVLHANGLGTPANPLRAYAWFVLADEAGSTDGRDNRVVTERSLSPGDVEKGRSMAEQIRENIAK